MTRQQIAALLRVRERIAAELGDTHRDAKRHAADIAALRAALLVAPNRTGPSLWQQYTSK